MSDPFLKAVASAPPLIRSGCTWRYDPAHLGPELGTDFSGAEDLWALCQPAGEKAVEDAALTSSDSK